MMKGFEGLVDVFDLCQGDRQSATSRLWKGSSFCVITLLLDPPTNCLVMSCLTCNLQALLDLFIFGPPLKL